MMLKSKHPSSQEQAAHLPPGLINHGNTCFMNSVLQGLIATRLLHDLVTFSPITPDLQRRLPTPLVSSRSPQLTNGHGIAGEHEQLWTDSMPIGDQFLHIMTCAWDAQSEKKRGPLSPRPLLTELGKKYQQYCDFAQQDAHEFLRILFDAMRMEEVDVIKKRQPPPPKRKSLKRKRGRRDLTVVPPRTDTPTPTTDALLPFPDMLFGGQLASILVCQKCKRISQTYEDFYDISLSIHPEDYASSSSSSSAFSTTPPLGAAANFFANSFKNVGKGKGKEVKDVNKDSKDTKDAKDAKEGTEEKEGDADEAELLRKGDRGHGHERKRDKFRKLARRIAVFNGTNAQTGTTKSGPGTPRSSSVPPSEQRINDKHKDIVAAKAAGGREVVRRARSRSLDHFHRVPDLGTGGPGAVATAVKDEHDNSDAEESATGRDETVTPPSDWDVVKEGEIAEIRAEKADEVVVLPPSDGKKEKKAKDKEVDGWTKLSKRLSMGVGLTRPSRDKDREREDDKEKEKKNHQDKERNHEDKPNSRRPPHNPKVLMNALFDDIRARRKSRESSPDPSWMAPDVPPVPPLPPLPPAVVGGKARPVTTPPSVSPQLSPHYTAYTSSPLSQPLHEEKEQPSLLETDSSVTLHSSPTLGPSSLSSSNPESHGDWKPLDNVRPSSPKHKHYRPPSPTPAEAEYLRQILADTDVSGSKSSPTPSGGWPPSSTPSHSLVNPFTLLMKSGGGAKNKASSLGSGHSGSDSSNSTIDVAALLAGGDIDARQGSRSGLNLNSSSHGGKWSSWLGMHRLSGIEECLRLFTSVEVLDNENMVGCRRCWKIANEGKKKGNDGEGEDEREDEDEDDEDDEDDDSDSNEDDPPPPLCIRLDTPGGMPIPIISTTGPEAESLFEPLSPLSSATPTRASRVLNPLRSNSADFISLSALSLRKVSRLDTEIPYDGPVALARNASSPSIPSALASPESQYSPPLPYPLSAQLTTEGNNGLGSSLDIPHVALSRRTRLASSTDGESDGYESGSAVDSSRSGEGTDFQDVDDGDGLSIGSSSSVSVSPSPVSREENGVAEDAGLAEIPEVPISESPVEAPEVGTRAGGDTTVEAEDQVKPAETTPVKSKSAKPAKKPKPVVMRPAFKRYLISSAPAILVIHLKRFQQMNKTPFISFTTTYGFRKLEDYVTFPEYLDLTPFLAPRKEDIIISDSREKTGKDRKGTTNDKKNERCMYRLYAVVVHIGNMLGGHYVAYTAIPDRISTRPDSASSAGSSPSSTSFGTRNESKTSVTVTEPCTSSSKPVDSTPPPIRMSRSKSGKQERRWAYISDTAVRFATLEEVLKARAYICMYEKI